MPKTPIAERLAAVRRQMTKAGVDVLIVRSTDRFLNEYVPTAESARVWISGFTGSMGEVVIAQKKAFLIVDGRYWMQAEKEADPRLYEVVKVGLGTGLEQAVADVVRGQAEAKAGKKLKVGFEPDRVTPASLEALKKKTGEGAAFEPLFPSPVEQARGADRPPARDPKIRAIDEAKVGGTVSAKLALLAPKLEALQIDALLVQRLDDIAWLSNLRGEELPYQATFKSIALVTPEALFVGVDPARVPAAVRSAREGIFFVPEQELWSLMGKKKRKRVGFDPSHNTEQGRLSIAKTGATPVSVTSPIAELKAKKTPEELASMREAFARADRVVEAAIAWVTAEVLANKTVTEADFAAQVEALFMAHGAVGLSFRVISAAGENGAIIHYSDPNKRRRLERGELLLLDTGGYFAEGYATDLTRTFLLDTPKAKGTPEQRRYYTLVLEAAIAGMRAVLPEGATGTQLDAIVRAPLWAHGLNYNHGTGHGVGINVHEFPPRVSPVAGSPLEEGHVLSIEPGLYLPEFGGIRIENLCTVKKDPERPGFIRVVPLTFAKLDERLIDDKLLSADAKAWLRTYRRETTDALLAPPPKAPAAKAPAAKKAGAKKPAARAKARAS